MTYGIVKTYIFTQAGQEASKRLAWEQILQERYNGIYYHLIIEDATKKLRDKYFEAEKASLQKAQVFSGKKDLEERLKKEVEDFKKKRPRNKKYHSQS